MNSDILTENVDRNFEIIKTLIIDTKERVYSTVKNYNMREFLCLLTKIRFWNYLKRGKF